jgi:hypothetical protein
MSSLADHHSSSLVKLLILGDAKSGKTTALASLAAMGLSLRILDFDNLLDPLAARLRRTNPGALANVEYRSLRDAYKGTAAGTTIDGKPKAWIDSLRMLNHWKYDDVDLGVPGTWGEDTVLVIDSLSRWCDAAFDFHEFMTPTTKSGERNYQVIYGNAQDDMEKQIANITSPGFATNVIVIAHGQYLDRPDGTTQIFPQGIGKALSPKIPTYFPNFVRFTNRAGKRTIQLRSDAMISLANNLPPELTEADLSPDDGLAKIFAGLRGQPAQTPERTAPTQPKAVTLVRRS